jgi:hypothetical protein
MAECVLTSFADCWVFSKQFMPMSQSSLRSKIANISLMLYTDGFFASSPTNPTQMGLLSEMAWSQISHTWAPLSFKIIVASWARPIVNVGKQIWNYLKWCHRPQGPGIRKHGMSMDMWLQDNFNDTIVGHVWRWWLKI